MSVTMRAWRMNGLGDPSELCLEEIPRPVAGPGEVLVEVSRIGVNYADGLSLRGKYQVRSQPPWTPGPELVGRVAEAGAGAADWIGRRVMANVPHGAAAEYCLVRTEHLRSIPEIIGDTEAAAIPIVFPTAHIALFHGRTPRPDDVVLVLAAGGGVGTAAVQLAKWKGAKVIAAASSPAKLELARSLGADLAVDYGREGWTDEIRAHFGDPAVDILVDPVGGSRSEAAMRLLKWRGRHAIVGFASGEFPTLRANRLLVQAITAVGVYWSQDAEPELLTNVHADLHAALSAGVCRPVIGAELPFERYPEAIVAVETGGASGKVVVRARD